METGACRGVEQTFTMVVVVESGPGFSDGPAQVEAIVQVGIPATRTVEDTFATSQDLEVETRTGLRWAE
ncbi:MAG TPA: hypothetical protein VNT56_05895 [Acidimicrobiales bacterium]|nr:hypothetical protein [Acidimicrobiales bacterium]